MEFYILLAGVEIGPLTERQIRTYLDDGLISGTDLSRRGDLADWVPVTEMLAHLSTEAPATLVPSPLQPETSPSPVDILAASEPSYPLSPTETSPEAAFQTSPLPSPSDDFVLSSTPQPKAKVKSKRKPSKLVIQPPTPHATPVPAKQEESVEMETTGRQPSLEIPFVSDTPSPMSDQVRAIAPPSHLEAPDAVPQPEPVATPAQSQPAAKAAPSFPVPKSRKKKTFWQKHSVLIYAAAALVLLIALPVCAWLFLGSKHNPFALTPADFASPPPATKDEEDLILASNPQTAVDFTKRGLARKNRGMIDTALSDFDQAVRLDPNYVPAYYGRGLVQLMKGSWNPAITDFNEVLNLDPRHADAFNDRGYAKQNKGDLDGAVADYTQALAIDPKIAKAYYNRGVIKLKRGAHTDAIADFNHTLDLDPTMAYAYFNRGDAKNADGNLDGAIADYTQALDINPKIALAYADRGFARQAKGDIDGAIDDYTQALNLNSNLPVTYYNLAMAHLSKGDLDNAIDDSTKAIALNSQDAPSYLNRGLALLGKGQLDDAKKDLQSFCTLTPHDPDADTAHLYLWLIATEQNPKGSANDDLDGVLLDSWNSPPENLSTTIARFLIDRVGESDVFAAADASDPIQNEVQHGKAWYFAGMKRLLNGDQATAVDYFRKVLQSDRKDFCEYFFARAQLRALGQSFNAPAVPDSGGVPVK